MKPPVLAGFPVDILPIPIHLLTGLDRQQLIENQRRFPVSHQFVQRPDVRPGLLLRNADQLLDIRAKVVHVEFFRVQHHKDVIYIA